MAEGGYIKIWRKIRSHRYWKEKRKFSNFEAWVDLIMSAAGIETEIAYRDQVIKLKRGQMIIAERRLSEKWKWSRERVRRFVRNCLNNGEIRYLRRDHRISVITIEKYNTYNPPAEPSRNKYETTDKTTDKTTDETKINKDKIKNKKKYVSKDTYMSVNFKNNLIFKWNELAQKYNLPAIKEIKRGSTREKHLKARIKEDGFDFDLLLKMVENSPFLLGKTKHGFFVFFDWIIKPSNYQKIIEGNYLDRQSYQKFSGIIEGVKELEKKYRKDNKNGT